MERTEYGDTLLEPLGDEKILKKFKKIVDINYKIVYNHKCKEN